MTSVGQLDISRGVASSCVGGVIPPTFSDLIGKFRFNEFCWHMTTCFSMT